MTTPHPCSCLEAPNNAPLDIIKTYDEDSHASRRLMKCRSCGRLYFKEYSEQIDWIDGEDPQRSDYILVASESDVDAAVARDAWPEGPHIVYDWPKSGDRRAYGVR